MRFALGLDPRDLTKTGSVQPTLELAKRADEGGIDALWLTEDPDGWDAFAMLGAISQQTERIWLGTGVTNPYLRHPDLIAASIATLERLAPGRAFLGLGRGQPEWYERALGMEIGNPLRRLDDTISLLRQWETDGIASLDGEFSIDRWIRSVRPEGHPPIYLATAGPKALELAGHISDGVLFNMLATPDYLARAIRRVKDAAVGAGRDPAALHFVANPAILVTDNPGAVLRSRKRFVANVLTLPGMDTLLENPDLDVSAIMRDVRVAMKTEEILARGGAFRDFSAEGDVDLALAAMPDALVERGSAVGSLRHVRDRIREYQAVGVTELMLDRAGLPADSAGIRGLLNELRG